jgi:hypothetical protein
MIRASRGGGERVDAFLQNGIVALGVQELGRLDPALKKGDLLKRFAEKYPEMKEGARQTGASQVLRFLPEIRTGDESAVYLPGRRLARGISPTLADDRQAVLADSTRVNGLSGLWPTPSLIDEETRAGLPVNDFSFGEGSGLPRRSERTVMT